MSLSVETQRRIILALLGLATIVAGVFTWRAGQIASTAAFDDRQSVSQTLQVEEQNITAALEALSQATAHVRYVTDYTEARVLNEQATALDADGEQELAGLLNTEAGALRTAALERVVTVGVFGRVALYAELATGDTTPVGFDFTTRLAELRAEAAIGFDAPGILDPDDWARKAFEIRENVRSLRIAAFVILVAVFALTVAVTSERTWLRAASAATGLTIALVISFLTFGSLF